MWFIDIKELSLILDCVENAITGNQLCELFGSGYSVDEIKVLHSIAAKVHNYLETLRF